MTETSQKSTLEVIFLGIKFEDVFISEIEVLQIKLVTAVDT